MTKIISATLISLALLAGAVAPAAADYYPTIKQLDKDQRAGHGGG
jgi:hypothetical protein